MEESERTLNDKSNTCNGADLKMAEAGSGVDDDRVSTSNGPSDVPAESATTDSASRSLSPDPDNNSGELQIEEAPTDMAEILAQPVTQNGDVSKQSENKLDDSTVPTEVGSDNKGDDHASNTLSILQTPQSVKGGDQTPTHVRSTSTESAPAIDDLNEYIQSPEVSNAIVERSPGERYVRFMEKLGSGASKDVYRAYDTQEGIEVAWNVVNLSGVPKAERNRIVNEVRLLERLHHPNIISFHGSWVNRERQEVNFVTEILSSGTLKSFIHKVQVIRWKIAKRWAAQILQGLEYLHSQDPPVIHRDLKCDNIFINGTSGDLRIGDLGLSTVHRNGQVLSVLGTPEFMAPDMYEEQSYDSSVDIYAFGMCLLEIFTQEIPYSECTNPAQIYRKVSSGELPEVLSRLQSRHARDFVIQCLGKKNEQGKYVRPSASELLKHPFLEKRANDDDEVVVEPPLRQQTILESAGDSSQSINAIPATKRNTSTASTKADSPTEALSASPLPRQRKRTTSDDEDGDRFEEMPQSETNMRKVKVMMGRGQELKEEEEVRPQESSGNVDGSGNSDRVPDQDAKTSKPVAAQPSRDQTAETSESQQSSTTTPQDTPPDSPHFLVAAAVIENEGLVTQPYPDGIMKLVVTLPVEGQTQNVQFDFHLVEDDPVQVAKEMVQELRIPQEAVLEISETISRLACAARKKQEKVPVITQNPAHQQPQQSLPHSQQMQSQGTLQGGQQEVSRNSILDYSSSGGMHSNLATLPQQPGLPDQTMQMQAQPVVQQSVYVQPHNSTYGHPHVPNDTQLPSQALHSQIPAQQYLASNVPSVQPKQQQGQPLPPPHGISQLHPEQSQQASHPGQQMLLSAQATIQKQALPSQVIQPNNSIPSVQASQPPHVLANAAPIGHQSIPTPSQTVQSFPSQIQQHANQTPMPTDSNQMKVAEQGQPTTANPRTHQLKASDSKGDLGPQTAANMSQRPGSNGVSVLVTNSDQKAQSALVNGTSAPSPLSDGIESDEDTELTEEMRKLDANYKKNLQRQKKVFDLRMDNLQKSQVEREAQHQKMVEKYNKERADFEKRVEQAKEQQRRTTEQLERERNRCRESLAQHKRKSQAPAVSAQVNMQNYLQTTKNGSDVRSEPKPLSFSSIPQGTHVRTMSGSSSRSLVDQQQQDIRAQTAQMDSQER